MEHASHMRTLIHAHLENALTLSAPYSRPEKEMQQPSMSFLILTHNKNNNYSINIIKG